MRKVLLGLIISLPLFVFAQDYKTAFRDFSIVDYNLVFAKVYKVDLSEEELESKIKSFLPAVNNFKLDYEASHAVARYSGTINKMYINYRKYGGTLLSTATFLNYPISANVIIDLKDSKYRVTIKDIVFNDVPEPFTSRKQDYNINTPFLKKKNTEIKSDSEIRKSLEYINLQLSDSFDITNKSNISESKNW